MTPYLETINRIRKASGAQAKQEAVRVSKDTITLQLILLHTYHPTWSYYIKKLPFTGKGTRTLIETEAEWISLLKLSNDRVLSGDYQKREIGRFIESLNQEEAELFKCIIGRDLKAGIKEGFIKAMFPGLLPDFGFMKAKKYETGMINDTGPLYASLKIDCIRGLLRGNTIYSSGGIPISGVQHIARALPKDLELDGEMTIPNMDFNAASGLLRSNNDCPTAIFRVFDVPSNKPFSERYEELKLICEEYPAHGISLVKHGLVKSDARIDELFIQAIDNGYEGLVLKTPHHPYQLKRSKDWLKVKAEDPEDGPIVDFEEGTGKFVGTLGAVIVKRPKNGVLVSVSGFTTKMKDEIWNNKEKWRYKTIAYKYHEETPDGSLRHPRFDRERWDKDGNH